MFHAISRSSLTLVLILIAGLDGPAARETASDGKLPKIAVNDNRRSAGLRNGDTVTLKLRAAVGLWRPEGDKGPALQVEAFGEADAPLQVPAPLIRVSEGTEIVATVRNDLEHPLQVHGLCARDGTPCAPLSVQPRGEATVRFASPRAGTYHYWATSTGMPQAFRAASDTQLSGAFIVDPSGGPTHPDRVLVLTEWTSLTRDQLRSLLNADDIGRAFFALNPKFTMLINGLSWPATERLTYEAGQDIRWRVINLTTQPHPMHLHGSYFTVDALGDGLRDVPVAADRQQRIVTQLMGPGTTLAMTWTPEREGNWLFHCHISEHVSPHRRLADDASHAGHAHGNHEGAGMAGMVLGVTVTAPSNRGNHVELGHAATEPRTSEPSYETETIARRKLTLLMLNDPQRYGTKPAYGFALAGSDAASGAHLTVPGPTLVLKRGEPVDITLVNRLNEATAVHWHGMELDSYYDGVHGWSGVGTQVTPLIEPGRSFSVKFTPPRTGTFIYHTHLHDDQLPSGMYGALLVVDPGETFDPAVDHVVVLGRNGPGREAPAVLNGSTQPEFVWKAGARHRVRLINITPDDVFVASLAKGDTPLEWTPLTKDGAPVPSPAVAPRPATQTIAVGETYDFEFTAPAGRQTLWLNVRTVAGRWMVQARIGVK
jgi:manganese oxidase